MPDDSSALDRVMRKLYARKGAVSIRPRHKLRERESQARDAWAPEEAKQTPLAAAPVPLRPRATWEVMEERRHDATKLVSGFLLIATLFFAGSLAVALWFFLSGSNMVSSQNVAMDISGPVAIPGGDELVLQVDIKNKNPMPLLYADLVVQYPEGTRSAGNNLSAPLRQERISLGTIDPGESRKEVLRSVLFGQEQTEAHITLSLEYRLESSNAVFSKDERYAVLISASPLVITVETFEEISSGQKLPLTVSVTSNAAKPLKDILLVAEYPFGFSPSTMEPEPVLSPTTWELGDMNPGETRTVRIEGLVAGSQGDERVFRFRAGSSGEQGGLLAAFYELEKTVRLQKPFLSLTLSPGLPENEGYFVAARGAGISNKLSWQNNTPFELFDLELSVSLEGNALDKASVSAGDGYYDSLTRTVHWTFQTQDSFDRISPGERGTVSFSMRSHEWEPTAPVGSPVIALVFEARAKRIGENDVPESIVQSERKIIRIASDPVLEADALYSVGPFTNSGPVPPRVEQRTTYTLRLMVKNNTNDLREAEVVTRLPVFVEWLGKVSPDDGSIIYNPATRNLLWRPGAVPAGAGYRGAPRQAFVQVAVTPSLSQQDDILTLLEPLSFSAVDRFTASVVKTQGVPPRTTLLGDPSYGNTRGAVQP